MAFGTANSNSASTLPLAQGTTGVPSHPRRPPAHASVSLLHASSRLRAPANKRSQSSSSSGGRLERSSGDAKDSPSSLRPLAGRGSSGESSNAENWFEKSNNAVRNHAASFADHDPPFFLRNSSSDDSRPDPRSAAPYATASDSLPMQTGMLRLGTEASSTDEYRGVIDDLTVQNKKLKQKLKKYEQLHDSHLKDEKLFEVRIHGLPPQKKRELEEMLRNFASSLGTKEAFPTDGYNSLLPMLKTSKTPKGASSSHASLHQTDSAYASMSASGQGSSTQAKSEVQHRPTSDGTGAASNQRNIHSYLHDIPAGLLPRQNPSNLSEKARKKLVVRKLEQLFAGKGAVGGHHHPLQQQEVSQSAALADRSAIEASGQRAYTEGLREASILSRKRSDPETEVSSLETASPAKRSSRAKQALDAGSNISGIEQRPTRPLDLDPERAQVPVDNVRYMQHMGFSPPGPDMFPREGHGWIYINFLVNMAQLHTMNVTTNFVRDAVSDISKELEVSDDGRKLRWKGGKSITRTSSSGGDSPFDRTGLANLTGQSPRKRPKLMHSSSSNMSHMHSRAGAQSSKHAYTPLFVHRNSMDDSGSESDSSSSFETEDSDYSPLLREVVAGDSSGMTSSGGPTTATATGCQAAGRKRKKAKRENGPIIFYSNARFCTDLSGERKAIVNPDPPKYATWASRPIGADRLSHDVEPERRGPLDNAMALPEPMSLEDNPIPQSMELSVEPFSPAAAHEAPVPIDMKVTGMGGVCPDDNFTVIVEKRHARLDPDDETYPVGASTSRALTPRIAEILHSFRSASVQHAVVGHEITSTEVQRLQPSELPPALGLMSVHSSTEEDSESDEASEVSDSGHDALRPAAPQPVDFAYTSSDEGDSESDAGSDDEDGEVDFLAEIRQANPEFVRAQEREYDANAAERLATEIPAGSSAATAGGGSGFNSPASGVGRREYRRVCEQARAVPGLQRAQTDDSTAVQGHDESSEQEDSDGAMSDVGS